MHAVWGADDQFVQVGKIPWYACGMTIGDACVTMIEVWSVKTPCIRRQFNY